MGRSGRPDLRARLGTLQRVGPDPAAPACGIPYDSLLLDRTVGVLATDIIAGVRRTLDGVTRTALVGFGPAFEG
ncbi:hypothetical protein [Amycolatopsis sp. SID8362]|uniref:hypothetical protein n=1 Tax=Amycolatopsis sp. SID8362 TaxID=2690346 RepID=UPI00136AD0B9|nr:hypothetical protein [Amycolatopsis sp. SID8362]NBH06307.1 hypothetical protein [Amycolatopsis sp. SID8362]